MDPISLAVASHASNYMQPGSQHDGNIPQQQQQQQSMDMSGTSSITLSPHRTGDIMNLLDELKAEREALDPAFVHCIRLVDQEIAKLVMRSKPSQRQEQKVYISFEDSKKFNLVGRLLGPKGLTLKRIQGETQTKMSILGRGSIRDRAKEEELRNSGDPTYAHLSDDLHVLVESIPPGAVQKLAAGVAEVRKMLIPPEPGQPDFASKYDSDLMPMGGPMGPPSSFPPFGEGRGRGRGRGGGGGGPPSRGGRGGRGGGPGPMRGRGGRGRGRGGPPRGGQASPNGGRGGMRGGPPRGRFDSSMPRGPPPPRGPPHDSMDYKHGFRDGHNDGFPERRDDYGPPSTGGDSFYSSFSDNPENNDSGEWMGGRHARRDYRPHPYY